MNLIKLLIDNSNRNGEFRIVVNQREATVYVYDVIGDDYYGGVSAKEFSTQIAALDVDVIRLRINSPGGDVFAGVAMGVALRQHPAKVIASIDGQAASAATRLAAAADEVEIAPGAFYMIHNAWTMGMGNASEFAKTAKLLSDVDATIVADYARKTKQEAATIEQWMQATTWFTADEAIANGFADRLTAEKQTAKNHWNLSAYGNAPKALTETAPTVDREQLLRRLQLLERIAV
jgi:ATP-dependent protease ClpP protease subunit